MSDLLLAIVSLIVGVAATLIVGRYYFRRTVAKSLTPYLHFSTPLFRSIAPEVRGALHVEYNGRPVEELMEAQFLVANTGERAIHDVIEPLTLALPDDCSLLDASLLHISPADRRITLSKTVSKARRLRTNSYLQSPPTICRHACAQLFCLLIQLAHPRSRNFLGTA